MSFQPGGMVYGHGAQASSTYSRLEEMLPTSSRGEARFCTRQLINRWVLGAKLCHSETLEAIGLLGECRIGT